MIARRGTQRAVLLAALALAIPALAGCGIDAKDETSSERSQVQATDAKIGGIKIADAFITNLGGADALPGATKSYLVVTLVNTGPKADTFTGVSTGLGEATLNPGADTTVGSNGVTLPPGVVVQISDPEINPAAPTLTINGNAPTVGVDQQVTFTFATAGSTPALTVPVVAPGGSLTPTQVIPTTQATVATPIA